MFSHHLLILHASSRHFGGFYTPNPLIILPEIECFIYPLLSFPDLIALGRTSKYFRNKTRVHLSHRFRDLLKSYVKDVDRLRDHMRDTGSVISGPNALSFFMPFPDTP